MNKWRSSRRQTLYIDRSRIIHDSTGVDIIDGDLPFSVVCDICKLNVVYILRRVAIRRRKRDISMIQISVNNTGSQSGVVMVDAQRKARQ